MEDFILVVIISKIHQDRITIKRSITMSLTAPDIFKDVEQVRNQAPLVHNITNYVVMNITANALLAIGASPGSPAPW